MTKVQYITSSMIIYATLIFCCICLSGHAIEDNYKKAIIAQKDLITNAEDQQKGRLLKDLALLYLKDQDQEHSFEAFLESLDKASIQKIPEMTNADRKLYEEALAAYLKGSVPRETAQKMISQFGPKLKENPENHLLGYLVAIAHANLNQFEDFFNLFYREYEFYPDHFLAFKTKAILHIKLMERKRTEKERQLQREIVLKNFKIALEREPNDVTLYKLLITFSSPETKAQQVQQCLNKIIADNIIIPRSDVIFYVQEAVDIGEPALAQRFIDKAREWYQQSRIITASQDYINRKKE